MTPFIIFSTPRSGSTLLMRMLDSIPGVRCAGECDGFLWGLHDLDKLRRKTRQDSPEAFLPLARQIDMGHFPSHYNPSRELDWELTLKTTFQAWVGAGSPHAAAGMKDVHIGKHGFDSAKPLWDWLIEIMPDVKFIFLTRAADVVVTSMMGNLKWWVPSYWRNEHELPDAVLQHQCALFDACRENADRSILLEYENLMDYDVLSICFERVGIVLPRSVWEQQISIKL